MPLGAYPAIAEHGLIGDLQTAALISTDGELDWFCSPRFDSPSIFASILDREKGGYFRIRPLTQKYQTRQLYLPDSTILVTRFLTPEGVGELIDFMPISNPRAPTDRHRIVRICRVVRGTMQFEFECLPGFDYGRASHSLTVSEGGACFTSENQSLSLRPSLLLNWDSQETLSSPNGDGIRVTATMSAGEIGGVVLESADKPELSVVSREEVQQLFDETMTYWRDWLKRSTYTGRWRENVNRSAMTLKLMTYAPTGALVAAPTAALPEQVGGERNWDYRFTWIRDASFSVYALLGLGYAEEARHFVRWLTDRVKEQAGSDRAH